MKTIKKSNSILKKGLLVFLSFVTLPVFLNGQVKVGVTPSNGDVEIGDVGATTPTHEFNVMGRVFITHNFRMSDSRYHSNMSGGYFDVYTPDVLPIYNGTTTSGQARNPIFRPQWGNYYYLGSPVSYFKELHIADGWLHNGGQTVITSDKRKH
jgi:hypothetical protein